MLDLLNESLPDGLWLHGNQADGDGRADRRPRDVADRRLRLRARRCRMSGFFKMPVEIVTTLMEPVDETQRDPLRAEGRARRRRPPSRPRRRRAVTAVAGRPGVVVMAKSFHELSSRTQMIIFGLLCVVAVAGAWQVSIGPGSAELETRRAHLAKLEGEIVRVQAIADKLPAAAARGARRSTVVAARDDGRRFRKRRIRRTCCATCTTLASESSLDIASFKPNADRRQGAVLGVADSADVRGRLSRPRPVLRPARVDVAPDFGHRPQHQDQDRSRTAAARVTVTCLATTFVFRQEVAAAPRRRRHDAGRRQRPGGRP